MSLDKNKQFPNQLADFDPHECGGITVADICGNLDGRIYNAYFSYAMTLLLEGVAPTTAGEDPLTGMQSAVAYGLLPQSEATFSAQTVGELYAANAANYTPAQKRIALQYVKNGARSVLGTGDDFADIKAAILAGNPVFLAMTWFSSFSAAGLGNIQTKNADGTYTMTAGGTKTGILPTPYGTITVHAVPVYDVATIEGVEYLVFKPLLGPEFGTDGYGYMSREICNTVCINAFIFDQSMSRLVSLIGIMVSQRRFDFVVPYVGQLLKSQIFMPTQANPDVLYPDWSTQQRAYHNVRVLCDLAGLTLDEKNLICACIYQESGFKVDAVNYNRNAAGDVLSTDYSLCQINDFYHIGPGKDFPSVTYVEQNPDKVVEWMISMYQHGLLKMWCSYSSGAFRQWLAPDSPMWQLITPLQ